MKMTAATRPSKAVFQLLMILDLIVDQYSLVRIRAYVILRTSSPLLEATIPQHMEIPRNYSSSACRHMAAIFLFDGLSHSYMRSTRHAPKHVRFDPL